MPLSIERAEQDKTLSRARVFVSASIPDPERWDGEFDALEITDAVVSLARAFLTAGARLVTAAHPTIAPLLLYVAAELPDVTRERIIVYQSRLFTDVLPPATRRFEDEGFGVMVWTPAVPGEDPDSANRSQSLDIMRRQMLGEAEPDAAVFIGGMSGIRDEWELFGEVCPGRPRYALAYPGGEARSLADSQLTDDVALSASLSSSRIYPTVWRQVVDDLRSKLR
jgi:hypothetical protein